MLFGYFNSKRGRACGRLYFKGSGVGNSQVRADVGAADCFQVAKVEDNVVLFEALA